MKKYAEAVTFFDIAIQKKFNTGNAYARKALALDALKKTDEYVATLEEGLKVDPNNKTMIKNYGLHYLKAGLAAQKLVKLKEAEECFKKGNSSGITNHIKQMLYTALEYYVIMTEPIS